jgi:hypothetical protein
MKSIPFIDSRIIVDALGGEEETVKLGDSIGMDLSILLDPGERTHFASLFFYRGPNFNIEIFNYENSTIYYPDIRLTTHKRTDIWGEKSYLHRELFLRDIGEDETMDESILRVRNWFHNEVIPIFLEYLFS